MSDLIKKGLLYLRNEWRRRRLEAGEKGWGRPSPPPARLAYINSSRGFKVGIIGAGAQGLAQAKALKEIRGIDEVLIAELDPERRQRVIRDLQLPERAVFADARELLAIKGLDLVSVATTAPYHVQLGRLALDAGVKRILLEKPMDTSLKEAKNFTDACQKAGVSLFVNYSRRWSYDYRAIRRCVDKGVIGEVKSIAVLHGQGELAMHASHYFDMFRYLLGSEPVWVYSQLEAVTTKNRRGSNFQDPSGLCLFGFSNGARAYIDFSSDLLQKDPFIAIKGTLGRITVDEQRQFWTLQSRSQRVWNIPFVDTFRATTLFSRVVVELLSGGTKGADGQDGVAALEMILAAHLSSRRGQRVELPLADNEAEIGVEFP